MKTLSQYPGLIGAILARAAQRQQRRKERAKRWQALRRFFIAAVVRPIVGFMLGIVIALYLLGLFLSR